MFFNINPLDIINFVLINTVCFSLITGCICLILKSKCYSTRLFTKRNVNILITTVTFAVIIRYGYHHVLTKYNLYELYEYLPYIISFLMFSNLPITLSALPVNANVPDINSTTQQGSGVANNAGTGNNPTPFVAGVATYENPGIAENDLRDVASKRHTSGRIKRIASEYVSTFSVADNNLAIDSMTSKIMRTSTDLSVLQARFNAVEHAMLRHVIKQSPPGLYNFSSGTGSIQFNNIKCDMPLLQLLSTFRR